MSPKARFLKLPLNVQIFSSLILMIILVAFIIIFVSEVFTSMHIIYIFSTKKQYFLSMKQSIIETYILFMNLCLLQYEYLIKLFNYQIYSYLKDSDALKQYTLQNNGSLGDGKIYIYDPSNDDIPDNISSIYEDASILYVYCYSKNKENILKKFEEYVKVNYFSYLNNIKEAIKYRIPYLGDIPLLGEYLILFPQQSLLISMNNSRIKETYNYFNGNLNLLDNNFEDFSQFNYQFYKKFFEDFESNKLLFMDIMYNLRFYIFERYAQIENENDKEECIKNQSIFFQNLYFQYDSTMFFDTWNPDESQFRGINYIINNYIDFMSFHLSKTIDVFPIPLEHSTNKIMSKNLCCYFLMKQIIYVNITSDEDMDELNNDFLDNIYNKIYSKENITIQDCLLGNYYDEKIGNQIKLNIEFHKYYDIEYRNEKIMYQLNDDKDSNILCFIYSYPNYLCLKEISPNYFSFDQLDFFVFSFTKEVSEMINSSESFLNNIKYLMILCLLYIWLIILNILIFISIRTIREVTDPIIRLTDLINLNSINDVSLNEDIFEYKSDEEINEFFLLCKKLINGEIKDNNINTKNKVNLDIKSNANNNMIINNKMILELIESQKSLNKDDKQIYLLKQIYSNNSTNYKNKRHRANNSFKIRNNDKNSRGLNLIQLNSIKNSDNNIIHLSQDMNSEEDESDPDVINMKTYENLLTLTDYLYNGKNKTQNKFRMNINHTSTHSLIKLVSEDYSIKEKYENNNKNIRKYCKYVTYYWYNNAKKNKLFESK